MCRWGCYNYESTYMCKFCGTRFCSECLRGDFYGLMKAPDHCRKCNQMKCQGKRVEVVVFAPGTEPKAPKKSSKGGKGASKGKASGGKKAKKKR
ncbi:unnamed protein product [Rotaria sp. Silwood1]|nr:unnamed protein product [Rotaria sp. Silwood1]